MRNPLLPCLPHWVRWPALLCLPFSVLAAPPVVTSLDVRALQTGTVTTVTFSGSDLLPNPRVLSTARIRSQKVREGAKPNRVSIDIELEDDSVPGFENGWLVTDAGVSARAVLAVDALPQRAFSAQAGQLPVALHGTVDASQVREVAFAGKAGQTVQCEVEAQRIQSRLRPVLKLLDSRNTLLAWSPPQTRLRGDCRLEFKLPADGEYRLQVHDLQYAAAAPSHFRLKVGQWTYADSVFPSTVQKGSSAEVHLVGNGAERSPVRLPSDLEGDSAPVPWGNRTAVSGPRPVVWLSAVPQVVEQEARAASPQQLPAFPVGVNGRISKPGEVDVYALTVQPETELELEVLADALGSPIDAELEVRDAKGKRLAAADDGTGTPDPKLIFKVPKDTTSLQVAVRDVGGIGGPECVYRLEAAIKAAKTPETFSLKLVEDSQTLRPGSPTVFKVEAVREGGFAGPIELKVGSLPKGVTVSGTRIPENATGTLLTFTGSAPFEPLIFGMKGRGGCEEKPVRLGNGVLSRLQPWLDGDVALVGVADGAFVFGAEWGAEAGKQALTLSAKAKLPVRVNRPAGHDGSVRFTLMTSQARIVKQAQLDTVRMLREEKPVVVSEDKNLQQLTDVLNAAAKPLETAKAAVAAATAKGAVADNLTAAVQKAQAAFDQAQKTLAEAAKKMKNDAEAVLVVPADLPEVVHQVAFKAELLKRDGKTVEAVAYTPVLELPVVNPIQIRLEGAQTAALDPKAGATVEVGGKVERLEAAKGELKGEVTVSLVGLPAKVAAPAAIKLKEGQTDFKFSLKFPPGFSAGPVGGIRVSASALGAGNVKVNARDADVVVTLKPADAPAEAKPPG